MNRRSQGGSALIAAIFLIVVVASLGAFAIRTGLDQQHLSALSWLEVRADAAAYSGLEFASNRLSGGALTCPSPISLPAASPGMTGFSIRLECTDVSDSANTVYQITATAIYGNFGNPDYVQRARTRRVSRIGPAGNW